MVAKPLAALLRRKRLLVPDPSFAADLLRRRDETGRLQVPAVPPEGRVRVVDEHERPTDQTLQVDEVADIPLVPTPVGPFSR